MHGQGAPSNISTKDKGLLPMKGQEPCYQNYFRNQVFFHFSIELIPILPTNAAIEGVLFAVVIYIKQHTSVNREAVRKVSLKSTWFDKACAVARKLSAQVFTGIMSIYGQTGLLGRRYPRGYGTKAKQTGKRHCQ